METHWPPDTKRIDELRAELEKLEKAELEYAALTLTEQTAIALHSRMCTHNHIDDCSWGYEGTDWSKPEHARWLKKAKALLDQFPATAVRLFLDTLYGT